MYDKSVLQMDYIFHLWNTTTALVVFNQPIYDKYI